MFFLPFPEEHTLECTFEEFIELNLLINIYRTFISVYFSHQHGIRMKYLSLHHACNYEVMFSCHCSSIFGFSIASTTRFTIDHSLDDFCRFRIWKVAKLSIFYYIQVLVNSFQSPTGIFVVVQLLCIPCSPQD